MGQQLPVVSVVDVSGSLVEADKSGLSVEMWALLASCFSKSDPFRLLDWLGLVCLTVDSSGLSDLTVDCSGLSASTVDSSVLSALTVDSWGLSDLTADSSVLSVWTVDTSGISGTVTWWLMFGTVNRKGTDRIRNGNIFLRFVESCISWSINVH